MQLVVSRTSADAWRSEAVTSGGKQSRGQGGPGQHLLKPPAAAKTGELIMTFG